MIAATGMRGALPIIVAAFLSANLTIADISMSADLAPLAREKAAAVSLYRQKAEKYALTLAQGRLFSAFLNASTLSEGERMRERLESSLRALEGQYGMQSFTVLDRAGDLFVHVGTSEHTSAAPHAKKPPKLPKETNAASDGEFRASLSLTKGIATFAAPVVRRGEKEFVISIDQDLTAYEKILAHGLHEGQFIVVVSNSGDVLADSRGMAGRDGADILAGLNLKALREKLTGTDAEAAGNVEHDGQVFEVKLQSAGDWIVIVAERQVIEPACLRTGETTCP